MTRLGNTETIHAVICFIDLRSFSALSVRYPPEHVANILQEFFSIVHNHVYPNGGEILKFMGDGALLVFKVPRNDAHRCSMYHDKIQCSARRALQALASIIDTIDQRNARIMTKKTSSSRPVQDN